MRLFLDITAIASTFDEAINIAQEIKDKIQERTQLTGSAGVSYNKFLAKIASDYNKPNGLFVITEAEAPDFIDNLLVERSGEWVERQPFDCIVWAFLLVKI